VQANELNGAAGVEQADGDRRVDLLVDRVFHHPHLDTNHGAAGGEEVIEVRHALARGP
jgi:hypothetical protein